MRLAAADQSRFAIPAASITVAPFEDVGLHARGHLVGRTPAHRHAHLPRFVLHVGTRNDVLHGLIERRNDAPWRRGRDGDAVPTGDLVVLEAAFSHGRHVGQIGGAGRAGRGQRDEFLVGEKTAHRGVKFEGDIDVAAQHGARHIGRGAERHDRRLDPCRPGEKFRGEVLGAARIDGAEIELAGIGLCRRHDVLHAAQRRSGAGHDQHVEESRGRDRGEVGEDIVRQRLEKRGRDGGIVAGH